MTALAGSRKGRDMRTVTTFVFAALLLGAHASSGQEVYPGPERLKAQAARSEDLKYPSKASSLGMFSGLHDAFFKPERAAPLQALLLLHTFSVLREDLPRWAKAA